jgi:hypothetical protein
MMTNSQDLSGIEWKSSLKSIHDISKLIGRIRREYFPPHPHWWHISLQVTEEGLTSGEILGQSGERTPPFRLDLNLDSHRMRLSGAGISVEKNLVGSSPSILKDWLTTELTKIGIENLPDLAEYDEKEPFIYDPAQVERIRYALSSANKILGDFRNILPGDCGPVQLWPHHFDLAFVRFTGQLVPGIDPSDVEGSRSQVNHGFAFGDGVVNEPYIYIIPYPVPDGLYSPETSGGRLQSEGFTGYVLPWESVTSSSDPEVHLRNFLTETSGILTEEMEG